VTFATARHIAAGCLVLTAMKQSPMRRIARTCYRRRRSVVTLWIGLLVLLTVLGSSVGGELRNDFSLPGAESQDATDLLEAGGLGNRGGYAGQIVFRAADGVDDPAVRSTMERFFADVTAEVPEVGILSPYSDAGRAQVAPNGSVAFAEVQFGDISLDDASALADQVVEVRSQAELPDALQVELGGELFFEEAAPSSEALGFVAAMIILLIAFGSVLAMGLPLVTALFGIGCGLGLVMLAAIGLDIPEFGPQGATLVAIGVGIDYALLIVTRFRDELQGGQEPEEAVVTAMATAGRSVFFAGSTVVVALAGLLLGGVPVIRSLAVAMCLAVLMVMLASLTLVPALLGFAGRNIDRLSVHRQSRRGPKDPRSTVWYRWSRVVQRRPGSIALIATVVLVLLALPVFGMHLGLSDAGNRPDTDTSRRSYDLLSESFGPGYNGPLFLAADLPGDPAEDEVVLERLGARLEADRGVAAVQPPITNETGDAGFVQVFPTGSPQDADTFDTVHRLRDEVVPSVVEGTSADVLVGGMPAWAVDFGDVQRSQMPIFIAAVLVLSFVLLLAVFRSVLVAVKAVIMNTLSIGAAYGAVVALFQWGWGADLLGLGEPGPVEAWAPMTLFAIVFGLSIDYEVFLLSRMKEEYDLTGDTSTAVADGLAKTARLITAAAAIMVCVAGGFVLSDERGVQIFGLGLAVAIFVDAAIVRTLLVPAAMELLGDRNWWLPRWLDRILPRLDVDGGTVPVPASANGEGRPREPEPVG
jgi:RND superfamily putative drug exporter